MAGLGDFFKSLIKSKKSSPIYKIDDTVSLPSTPIKEVVPVPVKNTPLSMVRKFSKSLDYNDLPTDWATNPEFVEIAKRMYEQRGTYSPFFRAWWNKSNLPLNTWYHGSPVKGIQEFDPNYNSTKSISGFFTSDKELADAYSKFRDLRTGKTPNGEVIEAYVRGDNPVSVDSKFHDVGFYKDLELDDLGTKVNDVINYGLYNPTKDLDRVPDAFAATMFNERNADVVKNNNLNISGKISDILAVRNPNQIKAKNNIGTFNPNDPNIYKGLAALAIPTGVAATMYPTSAEASGLARLIPSREAELVEQRIRRADRGLEEAWNPIESIATAPIGAATAGMAGLNFLSDAILSNTPVEKFFNSKDWSSYKRDPYFGE